MPPCAAGPVGMGSCRSDPLAPAGAVGQAVAGDGRFAGVDRRAAASTTVGEVAMQEAATAQAVPDDRRAFYDRLDPHGLAPLWEVLRGLVPPEPRPKSVPHAWSYAKVRPLLLEAGVLLTAGEGQGPAGGLENPALRGQSRIAGTIYAGIQLVLPGETAPAHRHTASALRLVLEGDGGYTAVAGERTPMHRGDFIITPSWAWHDHGNDGDGPVTWVDGLDIALVNFFEAAIR